MVKRLGKIVLILGLTILFHQSGYSQSGELRPMDETAAFKGRFDKMSTSTISIQSDFMQEKNLSLLDEKIITTGKFFFKAPGNLRWEYMEPFQYLIVLNGKDVIIKDEEKVSKYDMESNKMFKEINDLMIELVQGKVLNNDKYKVEYFENDKEYILNLMPDNESMKAFLSKIKVYIDKADYTVIGIKMVESSGDYTLISFNDKTINGPVPDETFTVN